MMKRAEVKKLFLETVEEIVLPLGFKKLKKLVC